ncbi:MAG: archaeosortase/exosortase family protein [candidate division NC10 bacterium]|nr:archaeosortase/exosortase family protein [candidate division NC10 bacterium]
MILTLLQWGVEQTAFVGLLTEALARLLAFGISQGLGVPARLEGLVIEVGADRQAVTPNCFGLIAITAYLAGLLAVPTDWASRWRGIRRDVPLLVLANGLRIILLVALGAVSAASRQVGHVIILVALAPLMIMGLWGLWLTRDLRALPHYPRWFAGLVALLLLPAIGVWWLFLYPYLLALLVATKAILIGLFGLPIGSATLVEEGLRRFLDLTLPEGGLRLEVAARSLSLAPFLALVVASPLPWARRLWLCMLGLVTLFALHTAESTSLIVLGRSAQALVSPAEALSDFLTVATGPLMWFLLAAPSRAWWAPASAR